MNSSHIRALSAIAAMTALASMGRAQISNTAGTASVDIEPAMSLTLVASPSWGKVTRPQSGTAEYRLDYETSSVTLVAGHGFAFNNGQFGQFTLSGAPSAPVSYSVSIGAFSGEGVKAIACHINGTSASGSGRLGPDGNMTLRIGGILDVSADATIETQIAPVTVTVDYQ